MEGETREGAFQGKKVVGSVGRMMKERTVNMQIKKGLHDRIIVPTITYTWVWNERPKVKDPRSSNELHEKCLWNTKSGW